PAYKRLSRRAEALIAEAYLAGMNTRRVRRALARLFAGHVGKDVVSRAWQRTRSAWEAWQKRDLADADIVRLILDGTVVKVRLDRKAAAISLLIVLGVRRDGQKVVLAIKNMGGESEAACASQLLQVNFSRTCSTTFHQRGTHSSVSVTSSPSLRTTPPHLGQAQGAGWTMRSRGKCSGSGRRAGLRLDVERGVGPAGCRDLRRRLLLGDGLLELSELELELGDDLRPTLGGLAVLLTARLGEQQLQALDLEPGAGDLGFSVLGPRFGRAPRRPLGEDHRMRGGEIGGQRIGAGHAPD
ncbi:MAG: transposase, partial [Geminicoccaceae bacterium]|nr:transposase [Geminicoccaceae bacterium]